MILIKTPLRVSFFGGGTDFPDWYKENPGCVISTAIDKYCYIQIRKLQNFFDHKYRIRYYVNEECSNIKQIKHPVIKSVLQKYYKDNSGLEIIHNADLPARSGLGSSSAFTASVISAVFSLNKKKISKRRLLDETLNMEHNILKEHVGSQDQAACINGGFNYIKFSKNNLTFENLYELNKNKLEYLRNHLSLFFIGFNRDAKKIEKDKIKKMHRKTKLYKDLVDLTLEAKKVINNSNKNFFLNEFSSLLKEQWYIKKNLSSKVSNSYIDSFYQFGLRSGAIAGKILGAGSGGFFLFLSDNQNNKNKLISKLKKYNYIHFNYDFEGTKKIYGS